MEHGTINESNAAAAIKAMERYHQPVIQIVNDPQTNRPVEVALLPGPDGFTVLNLKEELDQWLDAPRRLRGTAQVETLQSFIDLVNRHKTPDSAVFATGGRSLIAVIDYHTRNGESGAGSKPSFGEHRLTYAFPFSVELTSWLEGKAARGQQAFAEFLDSRRFELVDPEDIGTPDAGSIVEEVMLKATAREKRDTVTPRNVYATPADLMMLVEKLHASTRTKWSSATTDRYGNVKLSFEKEGRVEGGEEIPPLFLVEVPPFVGAQKLVLPARLRATVADEKLKLWCELVGVDRVLERGFTESLERVARETMLPVYRGSPEK